MSSITYIAHGSDLIVEAYQGRGDDELQEQQASVAMSITVPGIGVNPLENGLPHSFSELRDFLGIMGERPQGIQVGIVSVGYAEAGRWTEAYIESQTDEADMFTVADTNGASKLGYFNQRAEKTLRTIDGKDLFLPA